LSSPGDLPLCISPGGLAGQANSRSAHLHPKITRDEIGAAADFAGLAVPEADVAPEIRIRAGRSVPAG